ncbi:hypothetical protein AB205_0206730 [Aquarana catesbeiana]|uniref:G-protein coupled receptors family 1 profile domain-containing protein n=1 Tax=Aquarana catesbeiana TaxID=8400 RepID=A0A2G9QLU0_AQUCT|nr:hypothetical protein AB205_0206730 [Aquarana catesbeiana]
MNGQLTNSTSNTGFHILAFSTSENGRFLLLAVILLLYLIILIGNLLILTLVCLVPQLHTSMYFFLSNLSVLDNLYVSTTLPKLLYITNTGIKDVDNFFCDLKALITVSSSDTYFLRAFILVDGMFMAVPMLLILTSYACIISTILKIKSSIGRKKTFSSCTSHIIIVVVYYGSALCLYMQYSLQQDKVFAVMFVTLVPMLNPIVYSLRNKDITRAIQRTVSGMRTMPAA